MAQRKLAAIMFTDIVGYTSLLKEDEKKAFEILKKTQRIHKRLIRKFNGRWLKDMESGTLASFSSNIDAVMCALSIQKATKEIEIPIRIGIHQGDVIFEKKDVLGDGVNVASRIQSAIETNGIVISETVYNDIKNKDGLHVESLGERPLKGVTKPVEIYTVTCKDESLLDFSIDTGELIRPFSFGRTTIVVGILVIALFAYALYYFLPKTDSTSEPEKSILILPFENYLGSDTLDYFVASMHNALIGNIGKISALQVKSRTTANAYKDTNKTIPQIAAELGVNAIVETSILCSGDSICLEVRLVSTDEEEAPLWIKEYHEEASQILRLYNTITREISDEIDVNLRPQEEILLTESRTVDPNAYAAYAKGRLNLDMFTPKSFLTAIVEFNKAIEIDPDWAAPYAGLAEAGSYQKQMGFGSQSDIIIMIYKNLNKAQQLDPNSFYFHYTNAIIAVWTEYDWAKGEEEFKKALELNPSHVRNRSFFSHLLMILRKTDEAVYQAKKALELDLMNPFTAGLYVIVMADAGQCRDVLIQVDSVFSRWPDHPFKKGGLLEIYICLGDYDKAFEIWKQINYKYWVENGIAEHVENVYHEKGWIAFLEELIINHEKQLIEDDQYYISGLAEKYFKVGKYDRAMDYYEVIYEKNNYDPSLPYQSAKNIYDKMKDNPRYIELLIKMNLPVE